jgi:hypothetical protein
MPLTSRSEASAVSFGPSRYQNGGYPTGPGIAMARPPPAYQYGRRI